MTSKERVENGKSRKRCRSDFERTARLRGCCRIAGLDEAGRGCLFGPVFAAAVVLDPKRTIRGLRDSKELTAEEREDLAPRIKERAVAWALGRAEAAEIDQINIYQASRLAMRRALESIQPPPDYLLVDALTLDTNLGQAALIHGDARCRSIAAASILAKVSRDAELARWDEIYPGYGLASNKGYGTPDHLAGLASLGPTEEHRRCFAPVRAACGLPPLPRNWFRRPAFVSNQLPLFEEMEAIRCR